MIPIEFNLPIFTQTISLFLGLFILISNPKKNINRIFSLLVLSGIFWVLCVFLSDFSKDYRTVMFWTKISIIGPVLIGVLFYYLSLIFPRKVKEISRLQQFLIFFPVLPFIILTPTSLNVESIEIQIWGTDFEPGILYFFLLFHLVLYLGKGVDNLRKNYKAIENKIEKYQILYLSVAILGGLGIGLTTNLILPIAGYSHLSKYGPSFSILFFTVVTAISILRHHLLDLKVIITEALVFLLVGIMVIKIPTSEGNLEIIFNVIVLTLTTLTGGMLIKSVNKEIDRRKEMEKITKDLEEAYAELQKLDKAKTEFISIASHQLRTPLTAIKGYLSLIKDGTYGKFSQKMEKPINNVYISSERLIKLVNDLLNISRLEAGKIKLKIEKLSLEDIIDSVVEELKNLAQEKDLSLVWKKPKKPLLQVLADKDKIRQVVLNLVDNAIRYTKKGKITLRCSVKGGNYLFEIKDTGEGMNLYELSKLFKRFSRGSVGQRTWTEGSGLGLYIAKKFVDMHQGKLWAESQGKGKGSSFYLELPIN